MATPQESGYTLSEDPIYEDDQIMRYATDDPTIFIEFFEEPYRAQGEPAPDFQKYIELYSDLRAKLMEVSLENYIPEMVDYDTEENWVAFGIPEGLYALSTVTEDLPAGALDGRDWAWMLRRALMVMTSANRRPHFDERNFLVHPQGHGVVFLGWHPEEDPGYYPLAQLLELMEKYLVESKDAEEQTEMVRRMEKSYRVNRQGQKQLKIDPEKNLFGYENALSEFENKLFRLYGPPRFHKLVLTDEAVPFLREESKKVAEANRQ